MLKRTKGRMLLTLLVITGMAGTLNSTSLSSKERKNAVSMLKESKSGLLSEVNDLSIRQFNFISSSGSSIKNYMYRVTWTEKKLWETIENVMKQPTNPEKRMDIQYTDEELVKMAEKGKPNSCQANKTKPASLPWKSMKEATVIFKNLRNEHIKYMKISTEDLRNHVVPVEQGWADCYQLILMAAAENNYYLQLIQDIKHDPRFPKQ
jgi:hypothetical protein